MEILIKGGTVINARGRRSADVLIRDGVIAEIEKDIKTAAADRVIDATGLYVLPGAIDVHTHLEMKMGKTFSADGYESGTRAAACGGVTTVFDYTLQENGKSMLAEIADRDRLASGRACVDYAFHGGISEVNPERLNEVHEMVKQGFTSIKAYMTYSFGLNDSDLYRLLQTSAAAKALITVHAESDAIVGVNRAELIKDGPKPVWYHYLSRPEIAEEEADLRAIKLAEAAGSPIYIVHLANAEGERYIASYKKQNAERSGGTCGPEGGRTGKIRVFAETCPHYLEFTNEVYRRPDGIRFICSPPMKGEESRKALWDGVRNGVIDTIATDHCPAQTFEKDWGKEDFTFAPNGLMGTENMYPYMLDAAGKDERKRNGGDIPDVPVSEVTNVTDKLTYERVVELCSYNPAKIFGCDSKGEIAVGKDADIVLYDPHKKFTISRESMHSDLDYTIYEGKELTGYPVITMSRGMIVYRDGEFFGQPGYGKLLRRSISCAYM